MSNGWTIRSGDTATKLYAVCYQDGSYLSGELGTGTTIPGAPLPNQAAITAGTVTINAYADSVIANAGKSVLLNYLSGYGNDSAQQGAVMFKAVTAGPLLNVRLTAGGSGFTVAPTVSFSSGAATATATLASSGSVKSVTVTNGGSGYSDGSPVTFTGGGGSGATGTVVCGPGPGSTVIQSITINNGGTGYTSAPTPVFGTGSGFVGTVVLGYAVASLTLTSGGTGYTSAPTVTISGDGSGATGTVDNFGTPLTAGNYGVMIEWLLYGGTEYWPRYNLIPLTVTTAEA